VNSQHTQRDYTLGVSMEIVQQTFPFMLIIITMLLLDQAPYQGPSLTRSGGRRQRRGSRPGLAPLGRQSS
jgi:hypothetical protein